MHELVLTALEVAFVVLLAAGVGLVVAGLVPGLVGYGLALISAGFVALASAETARRAHGPAAATEGEES